ncbi:MAG TPA: 2-phospho-L-lactate guanylyltransferase [bacterium]|nr:2-phospho-L-lactate guanylyltransferase [bacterium]
MTVSAIIPQARLRAAKTRLAPALSPRARAALSLALLRHVCVAVRAVPAVEGLTIVSPDRAVRGWGEVGGWTVAPDWGSDLNTALRGTMGSPACQGRDLLIVVADLPWLRAADVASLLAASRPGRVVLAPSKDGMGTSALVVPAGHAFAPAFGPASRAAHHREAGARGLDVVEVFRPGIAFDLDTPDDLAALEAAQRFDALVWDGAGRPVSYSQG